MRGSVVPFAFVTCLSGRPLAFSDLCLTGRAGAWSGCPLDIGKWVGLCFLRVLALQLVGDCLFVHPTSSLAFHNHVGQGEVLVLCGVPVEGGPLTESFGHVLDDGCVGFWVSYSICAHVGCMWRIGRATHIVFQHAFANALIGVVACPPLQECTPQAWKRAGHCTSMISKEDCLRLVGLHLKRSGSHSMRFGRGSDEDPEAFLTNSDRV